VGEIVAERLGREFVDLDEMIEARAGKTIPQIFTEGGESYFRMVERQAFFTASLRTEIVLATGGGVVGSRIVRVTMKESGASIVYLAAPAETLSDRIRGSDRPSLTGQDPEDEIPEILAEREPLYREVAVRVVDASVDDPGIVADRVLDALFL
jgi:shikimate kinase